MEEIKKDKLKNFLNNIFYDLEEGEHIRISKNGGKYIHFNNKFFKSVQGAVNNINNDTFKYNTYFTLSTTDEVGGTVENLKYRYCLAYDWDLKDFLGCSKEDLYKLYAEDRALFDKNKRLLLNDIHERINEVGGLYYHYLVDSGYGYHVYFLIEKTNDINKVNEVNKVLQKRLNADINAIKPTQILRVPYTSNIKSKPIEVKIVKDKTSDDKFKRYNIDKLYKKYYGNFEGFKTDTKISYSLKKGIPVCVENALTNGSEEGNRDRDLYNIVIHLKNKGKRLEDIKTIVGEWNNKNKITFKELDYQTEYVYKNCSGFLCGSCDSALKLECKNYTISNFDLEQYGEPLISISNKVAKDIKYKNRKGAKMLLPNELFIYNVLLNNKDIFLSREGILKLITDRKTNKAAISERTLKDTLKGLVDKEYITVNKGAKRLGIADTYRVNEIKCKAENEFKITYFLNLSVIWGRISTEELHLYTYMRYLHHQEVLQGKAKGNIFTITMEELAKGIGVTRERVVQMTKNLYDNNILDRRAVPLQNNSNNSRQFYYQYKLNK